jgi:hypothetical protein
MKFANLIRSFFTTFYQTTDHSSIIYSSDYNCLLNHYGILDQAAATRWKVPRSNLHWIVGYPNGVFVIFLSLCRNSALKEDKTLSFQNSYLVINYIHLIVVVKAYKIRAFETALLIG